MTQEQDTLDQIRAGATVYDAAGDKVGTLRAYDAQGGYLDVEKGWLFPTDIYVPLSALQSIDVNGDVYLSLYKDDLQADQYAAPPALGTLRPTSDLGVRAAKTNARETIDAGAASTDDDVTVRGDAVTVQGEDEIAVPVREEELIVGKRAQEEGRVHLHKDVVTEEQTVSVPLTREQVIVERVPITDQTTVTTADAFQERDIDLPVMGEQAVVAKQVQINEEVRIHKDVVTEQQQVSETLRKERVTVEGTEEVLSGQHPDVTDDVMTDRRSQP